MLWGDWQRARRVFERGIRYVDPQFSNEKGKVLAGVKLVDAVWAWLDRAPNVQEYAGRMMQIILASYAADQAAVSDSQRQWEKSPGESWVIEEPGTDGWAQERRLEGGQRSEEQAAARAHGGDARLPAAGGARGVARQAPGAGAVRRALRWKKGCRRPHSCGALSWLPSGGEGAARVQGRAERPGATGAPPWLSAASLQIAGFSWVGKPQTVGAGCIKGSRQ